MKSLYFHHSLDEYLSEGPALTMLDRLELDISAGTASGVKAVSMGEPFFQGHFPGAPIMPGVLQVAAMVQAASVLVQETGETTGKNVVLKSLSRVKFRKPVLPGALLAVEVNQVEPGSFQGKTLINGETACSANFVLDTVSDMDFPQPDGLVSMVEEEKECEEDGEVVMTLDSEKVMAIIPHRFPFMFLDSVTAHAHSVIGYKNISGTDPLLADMIPEYYPGYLQVEAAAQTACTLVMTRPENAGKLGFFMSIDKAVFHSPVFPGDRLRMHVTLNERGRFGVGDATLTVNGRLVAEATMKFAIVDRD